jgi:hypothetical protein
MRGLMRVLAWLIGGPVAAFIFLVTIQGLSNGAELTVINRPEETIVGGECRVQYLYNDDPPIVYKFGRIPSGGKLTVRFKIPGDCRYEGVARLVSGGALLAEEGYVDDLPISLL